MARGLVPFVAICLLEKEPHKLQDEDGYRINMIKTFIMNNMNYQKILAGMLLLFVFQNMSAQYYNNDVMQYCRKVSSHPSHCSANQEFSGSGYLGLMMSNISGSAVEKCSLGGVDFGLRATGSWGYSCKPVEFELSAFLDLKMAGYITLNSRDDDSFTLGDTPTDEKSYTDYAAQLTLAPGIRINKWSIYCGPYIAYMGYKNDIEGCFTDPDVSGLDCGVRLGTAIHFENTELLLHYDIGLSDHDGKFKKNDLVLVFGFNF